jgi:hypothetical protein
MVVPHPWNDGSSESKVGVRGLEPLGIPKNVRQIPPGDPDFEILYRRRNDAESINRNLDDTLWLGRAHSFGNSRQLLNMITDALGVNALSMHVHCHGLAPPQDA